MMAVCRRHESDRGDAVSLVRQRAHRCNLSSLARRHAEALPAGAAAHCVALHRSAAPSHAGGLHSLYGHTGHRDWRRAQRALGASAPTSARRMESAVRSCYSCSVPPQRTSSLATRCNPHHADAIPSTKRTQHVVGRLGRDSLGVPRSCCRHRRGHRCPKSCVVVRKQVEETS